MRSILSILIVSLAMILSAAAVDEATAIKAAENWIQMQTHTRIAPQIHPEALQQGVWLCRIEEGGFVVIAADDAARPVIAWSESGDFNPAENPAAQRWLESIGRQMAAISEQAPINNQWEVLLGSHPESLRTDRDVEPLITSHWRQQWPYNAHCPEDVNGPGGHVVVGCCATAAAQFMRFWQHPEHGIGSHSYEHNLYGTISADFSEATYLWDEMPDTLSDYNEEVAEICFHAGVAMDMGYGSDGSGASFDAVYYALTAHFSYNPSAQYLPRYSFEDDVWDEMVREELDQQRPVYYVASEEDFTGHAFLIDGYEGLDFFHVNWGWGGNCDGYFYFSDLAPGSHDFTYNQNAFFDLYPVEQNGLTAPTDLVAEVVNSDDIQLTWTPPINDEGEWYSYTAQMSMIHFNGPERAILFDDAVFDFSYPATIQQIQHSFYDHVQNPWGDNDQFIVKIYSADFETVLYESSPQRALRYPTVTTHILSWPLTVYDDFYVSIRPVDEVTFCPSSTSGDCAGASHSWWGESGSWEQIDTEWMTSVNICMTDTGQHCVLRSGQPRNRMLLGYNIRRDGAVINPLWLVDPEYLDEDLPAGEYTYTVTAVYDEGESNPSNPVTVQVGLANNDDDISAPDCILSVYPNPFNPSTTIGYSLPETGHVEIGVYNIRGQRIRKLVDEKMQAGEHTIVWNGTDASGKAMASGIYFLKMDTGRYVATKKMIMLK